ncbi:hypothetical protein ACFFP0_01120 [Rhizobium puerariae]|uniref:Uncharacterized protein n=1 Tax=Rhizobium puerariae TaxID=1585791 RepID=A0ABV6ABG6_9HYPH
MSHEINNLLIGIDPGERHECYCIGRVRQVLFVLLCPVCQNFHGKKVFWRRGENPQTDRRSVSRIVPEPKKVRGRVSSRGRELLRSLIQPFFRKPLAPRDGLHDLAGLILMVEIDRIHIFGGCADIRCQDEAGAAVDGHIQNDSELRREFADGVKGVFDRSFVQPPID